MGGRSTEPAVRRAVAEEAGAVAELYLRSRAAAEGVPAAVHGDGEVRAWLASLVAGGTTWVTVEGGAIAAMMVLEGDWIEQLYVSPTRRRRGHGAALLRHAQSDRETLSLWTFAANAPARAFYVAHGFTVDGPASSDNEERAPALRYRWTRAAPGGPGR